MARCMRLRKVEENEHRTSNVQHRILNGKRQGKDEETEIAAHCLFDIRYLFFHSTFDVQCSMLDVRLLIRSMLDVRLLIRSMLDGHLLKGVNAK